MSKFRNTVLSGGPAYPALVVFLVLTFLLGGGSRDDIQSLVILRPLSAIFLAFGLWCLTKKTFIDHWQEFVAAIAMFVFVAAYLVPLPHAWWSALPGRGIVNEIDAAAGLGSMWRPATLSPAGTWNALFFLLTPLAVLTLGTQISREQRFSLLYIVLGLGLLSGSMGLVQSIGDPQGPLFLYKVTNSGMAVGLFANRNHHAVFLATLFPLIAVLAANRGKSEQSIRVREWMSLVLGLFLIPIILVTGSRSGLILGVLSLIFCLFSYKRRASSVPNKRKVQKFDLRYPLLLLFIILFFGIMVVLSRADSISRLLNTGGEEEARLVIWGQSMAVARLHSPIGTGPGSFAPVYKVYEPQADLSYLYVNHAHNELIELWYTGGWIALVMVAAGCCALALRIWAAFRLSDAERREVRYRRMGGAVVCLLVIASLVDYPLRTPSLAALFVLALLWLKGDGVSGPPVEARGAGADNLLSGNEVRL